MGGRSRFAVRLAVLAAALSVAATNNAYATGSAGTTRIISPSSNQVVGNGGVRVVVKSRASLAKLEVLINGANVKRYFHQVDGQYRANLRAGRGLQPGVDELTVITGADTDVDSVTFIVARQDPQLLKLSGFRVGGSQTPVLVRAKVASGSTLEAWINGHRDDNAFQPQAGLYVGRLGANDGLRAGRNRLVLMAYRRAPSQRSASYTVVTETFWQPPGQLTAGAGSDIVINAGEFVRLDGTVVDLGRKSAGHVSFRWKVTGRPRGVAPSLVAPANSAPDFEAKVPGVYLIGLKTTAADGSTSVDTLTVTAREDVPPMGARLDTVADDRGTIVFDGNALPNTTCTAGGACLFHASYAVFNRQTLEVVASGNVDTNFGGMTSLIGVATKYNARPGYLMVLNMQGPGVDVHHFADARKLFDALGVAKISDSDLQAMLVENLPISIVGVPGSPAGSAFISVYRNKRPSYDARHVANMSGYLRLNPAGAGGSGYFEFVFADQVEFNTDASVGTSQISMQVGDANYSHALPADGSSGFFMVRLNSQTLGRETESFYVTNEPGGSEDPAESKRLADDLAAASDAFGRPLVLLQAFGTPKGTSASWLAAAAAIGKLGGTAQVFAQLNQKSGDEPKEGRYAFVGRSAMDTAAAESSQALTGVKGDGKLHGLLGRGRDAYYEPLGADPSGTINFDLVRIINRPSAPGGGFPAFATPGEAAAAAFLGRQSDIIGVCVDDASVPCDVRKAYYEDMSAPWDTILTRLDNTKVCDTDHPGFSKEECEEARDKLALEIGRRNTVANYFARLESPFGAAEVAALVNGADIASKITQAVKPPAANNATSYALTVIADLIKAGGLSGVVCPACGAAAAGLSGVFSLAAYVTEDNGSPDLVGPQITATAADLGSKLFTRYQRASYDLMSEAQIVISDWSKMSDVAAVANSGTGWKLGNEAQRTESIILATKQVIYQALVPVAYPVLYDLGTGITDAKGWICRSPSILLYDKKLFQNTPPAAQMIWKMTDAPYVGQSHLIAVGARHTVGYKHSAYVPAPPDSLTGPLFQDSSLGGIGLYKLQFYSPHNFHVFPKVFQQTTPSGEPLGYWTCQNMPDPPGNSA
jgi:hypothetical protein